MPSLLIDGAFGDFNPHQQPATDIQCEKILALLKTGPQTSATLAKIALKYTSRISDLRDAGHAILATRIEGSGLWRYTLGKKKG